MNETTNAGFLHCRESVHSRGIHPRSQNDVFSLDKEAIRLQKVEWQQENASIHTATETKSFLRKKKINTIKWPAKSPDLNIIEFVWKVLSDAVYADGQFYNAHDFEQKILSCAASISPKTIKNLYTSITKRLHQVVNKNGDQI